VSVYESPIFVVVYPPGSTYDLEPARANGDPVARPSLSYDWNSDRSGVPHNAFDIVAGKGSPILARFEGKVPKTVKINRRGEGSRDVPGVGRGMHGGWYAYIDHSDGTSTYYAHMLEKPWVDVGQYVSLGRQIGRVGRSGPDSGPYHCHYRRLDTRTRRPIDDYRDLRRAYDSGAWNVPLGGALPLLVGGSMALGTLWATARWG